jgi:hypothetical protein
MKIIQDNWSSAQFIYPFKVTCQSCHSQLEIEQDDLHKKESTNQFDATYSYFTITCPLCNYVGMVDPQKK